MPEDPKAPLQQRLLVIATLSLFGWLVILSLARLLGGCFR